MSYEMFGILRIPVPARDGLSKAVQQEAEKQRRSPVAAVDYVAAQEYAVLNCYLMARGGAR